MKIFGIEKLSMVDYEGHLSCTLFTGGCNFRCPFCHNSSLAEDGRLPIEISEEEIFDYLERRKGVLDAVCISGGEPTINKDLAEFIVKIKALGYLVKLDTNGSNPKVIKQLVESKLIDYVAMDIKSGKKGYALTVGVESFKTKNVAETVEYLLSGVIDYEFRTTLVYELISESDIVEMSEWLQGAQKIYLQKFVDSGDCIVKELTEVPKQTAEYYKSILQRTIEQVYLRNY